MPYSPLQTLHGAKPNKQDTFLQKSTGIAFDTHRVYKVKTANNYAARREIIRAN